MISRRMSVSSLLSAVVAVAASQWTLPAAQAQFGTLKGQVVVDGDPVALKNLVEQGNAAAKDAAVCAVSAVPDESAVIDPASKGLANVVVYLKKKPKNIHKDLVAPKEKEVVFDQKGCRFMPHMLVVRTDQKVRVLSDDAVAHNTRTSALKNKQINTVIKPNDREGLLVDQTIGERLPFSVGCDIHPWMRAWWLVVDHPYAAVTDAEGRFTIEGLPSNEGELEFVVWQEKIGYVEKSLKVKIEDGKTNELKPMKVKASDLAK